jgi:hypothetical protein
MWRAKRADMAEQLSRYWDARGSVRAEVAARADVLDPAMTETIAQLYAHDDAELPDPSFLNRLETTLMNPSPLSLSLPSLTAPAPLMPNGRIISTPRSPSPPMTPRAPEWYRGMLPTLTTAALVILVLAGGFFAFGPGRRGPQIDTPAFIPALSGTPATPSSGVATEETLLEITIPAELLPQGDRLSAVFEQATSPAGSTGRWLAVNSAGQPGLRVHYVVDGSVIMRAEGEAQVLRAGAGSVLENVPAGTEVTLEAGDTWITRNEMVFEAVNPTEAPAEVLLWVVANIEDPTGFLNYPVPSNWTEDSYYVAQPGVELPPGPTTLRIRRVELPAKGRLSAPADGLQYGVAMVPNAQEAPGIVPSIVNLPDGRLANNGRKAATAYVLNFASAEAEEGPPASGTPAQ